MTSLISGWPCYVSYRLLVARLQTGVVVGDGHPRVHDVQLLGVCHSPARERRSCQPHAQWQDAVACGLRGLAP